MNSARLKVLVATWPEGFSGPQVSMRDLLAHTRWNQEIDCTVWHVEDKYRGVSGKVDLKQALSDRVKAFRPDVLYIDFDLSMAFWLIVLARAIGVRAIAVHARSALPVSGSKFYLLLRQRTLRSMATIPLAISPIASLVMYGRSDFAKLIPCPIDFVRLWRGKEATTARPRRTGAFYFGCVGRLSWEKSQSLLLHAFQRFLTAQAQNPPLAADSTTPRTFILRLYGQGGDRDRLVALAKTLEIAESVEFCGTESDIGKVYAKEVDAVVIPSKFEAQCRVAAEAQAMGKPLLISNAIDDSWIPWPESVERANDFEPSTWAKALEALAARAQGTQNAVAQNASQDAQSSTPLLPTLKQCNLLPMALETVVEHLILALRNSARRPTKSQ